MIYLYIALGAAALIILFAVFAWVNNNVIKVTRVERQVEGAPQIKIVHLSDLHGKFFGKNNCTLIAKVAAQKPNFIAFTGDIIHKYTPKNLSCAAETASALTQIAPVLFVAGNHEMRNKGYRQLRKILIDCGVIVLDDRAVGVEGMTVVGLNGASLRNNKIDIITPNVKPKILLAHEPQFFEKFMDAGYDLALCGHAHGGQWRIPFTHIGLYAPGQGVFPKYTSGVYEREKGAMIVSRGLGNSEFPLRLFNRPEIVVVEINKHLSEE